MTTRGNLSALTDEQLADFQSWRSEALILMPYMSRLLFSVRVLDAPGLGTFAVDRDYRMYIDFADVKQRGAVWCAEALLHECSHLFADHASFAEDLGVTAATNREWNVAADCAINDDLRDAGCKTIEADAMLPQHIGEADYQTPHVYFAKIRQMQQAQQQKQQSQPQQGQQGQGSQSGQSGSQPGSQGGQQGQPGSCGTCGQGSQGGQQGQGSPTGQGGGSQGGQQSGQGAASGTGQGGSAQGQQPGSGSGAGTCPDCGQQMPVFKGCGSGSGGQPAPVELPSSDDFGGVAPAASSIEKEAIRTATAAQIKDYVAKGRGTVPGGLVEIADKVLAPSKTPWQQVLASHLRRAVATKSGPFDLDRSRRNRRRHRQEIPSRRGGIRGRVVVPGTYTPEPTITVIRDTSGSMGANDIAAVTREVEAIAKRIGIRGDALRVLDVDAAVHQEVKFRGRKSLEKVAGRGGTSMTVGIEHIENSRGEKPTAIVVLTDGGTDWPETRGRIPVIAAIIPQGDGGDAAKYAEQYASLVPDFIKTVVVDSGVA
ncbi:vWA domain-containing protein [Nocardioides pakistanensis]